MSPRPEPTWSSVQRGVGILVALAVGSAAIFSLDLLLRELSEGPELVINAPEAQNLRSGAKVWVAGIPAGRVTGVRFRNPDAGGSPLLIRAVLDADAAPQLRSDASVAIRAPGLMQPPVVAVEPGTASARLDFSDTLRARPPLKNEDLMAQLDSAGRQLRELEPLARRLVARLEDGPGTLASLRSDTALQRDLRRLADRTARLSEVTSSGTAGRLAGDRELTETWRTLGERAGRLVDRLRAGAASMGPALDSLAASAGVVAARFEEGRGSLARFRGDSAVARELRRMRLQVDSTRAALMADPLRWLRFRLF